MSLSDPKEKLLNILPTLDNDTTSKILDFTEYLMVKDDLNVFSSDSQEKKINIDPLPMKTKWDKNTIIKRGDAYSEGRGL